MGEAVDAHQRVVVHVKSTLVSLVMRGRRRSEPIPMRELTDGVAETNWSRERSITCRLYFPVDHSQLDERRAPRELRHCEWSYA